MDNILDNLTYWLNKSQYNGGKIKGFIPKYTSRFRKIEVYPEITGYTISTYSNLYDTTRNKEYLNRAMITGNAIINFMGQNGAIPSVIYKDGNYEDTCYSFDQGIMTRGLLDLYNVMNKNNIKDAEKYLEAGIKGVNFIIEHSNNGCIPDQFYLDGNVKSEFTYCIMLKICRAYVLAFQITKDKKYLDEIIKVSNYNINKFNNEFGVFKLEGKHERNRIHYHCYAIEALIEILNVYDNKEIYDAALNGAEYLLKAQKENGGFNNRIIEDDISNDFEDVPPTAQAIAIWNYFYKNNKNIKYKTAIDKAKKYLNERQYNGIGNLKGGLPFMLPQKHKIACSWAVIFYIDSILQLEKVGNKEG